MHHVAKFTIGKESPPPPSPLKKEKFNKEEAACFIFLG
jgi:hypothetical protein